MKTFNEIKIIGVDHGYGNIKTANHCFKTGINNLITAMEQGIITPTTKARMDELETEKSELSIKIMKEEMSRPKLTREEILYWFYKFRKLNLKKLDHRRSLINNFVNSVFLYEDRMVINFNFKDGTETITFADLEKSALGSDLKVSGAPKRNDNLRQKVVVSFWFSSLFSSHFYLFSQIVVSREMIKEKR